MTEGLRLQIPEELALELVAEGISVRSRRTRGVAVEAAQLLVGSVNTGAALVTVATATAALPKLVNRLRSWMIDGPEPSPRLIARIGEKEIELHVSEELSDADVVTLLQETFSKPLDS